MRSDRRGGQEPAEARYQKKKVCVTRSLTFSSVDGLMGFLGRSPQGLGDGLHILDPDTQEPCYGGEEGRDQAGTGA